MKRSLILAGTLAMIACGPPVLMKVRAQLAPPASPVEFGKIPVLNVKELEIPC